jgi:Cyclin
VQEGSTQDACASSLEWPASISDQQLLQPALAMQEAHAPFLPALARHLEQICQQQAQQGPPHGAAASAAFQAARVPAISMHDYILRLARLTSCSAVCFVYALVYVQRAAAQVQLDAQSVHRCALHVNCDKLQRMHCYGARMYGARTC